MKRDDEDLEAQKRKLRDGLARSLFVKSVRFNLDKEPVKAAVAGAEFVFPDSGEPSLDLAGLEDVEKTLQILSTASQSGADRAGLEIVPADEAETWRHQLKMRLVKEFSKSPEADQVKRANEAAAVRVLKPWFDVTLAKALEAERQMMPHAQRAEMVQSMIDEIVGYGPITPLLRDPSVTEVMVNGPRQIYVERGGGLALCDIRFFDEDHLMQIVARIANRIGRNIDLASPFVDARLPDGSRVHAVIPPLAIDGTSLTIRKFRKQTLQMEDMLQYGALTPDMAYFLGACVKARLNILVSGGTGTGKTTLLNVLSTLVQPGQRLVTIEDAAELKVKESHPHVVRLETRTATSSSGGRGGVSIRDLVKCSLRMRPDRVIVGECRGGEALDMLQAMNTGHDGSMTTAHGNSARETIQRLETMCLMAGIEIPVAALRGQIATALDLVVHLKRFPDGSRKIAEISEVENYVNGEIRIIPLFWFEATGRDPSGKVLGEFRVGEEKPTFIYKFDAEGLNFPYEIFSGGTSKIPEALEPAVPAPAPTPKLKAYQAFAVDLNQIGFAAAWTMGVFSAWGFAADRIPEAELAMAEAIGNVARHAYTADRAGVLAIEVDADPEAFHVTLVDSGEPFDPTQTAPKDRQGDEEHGMGLSLMTAIADRMGYEYRDGFNRFTLTFARNKPAAVVR